MIITFDTGILVRATKRSSGPARRAVEAVVTDPEHVMALSPFIIGEVGKVLAHPRMQVLYGLSGDEIHEHVQFLQSVAQIVEPERGIPVVLSDPHDDAILYTAVSAGSEILCVRDRHFYASNVLIFCERADIRVTDEIGLLRLLAVR